MPGGDYRDALRERAGWAPERRAAARRRRRAGGGAPRARPATRSASARAWASRSASRATSVAHRPADEHDHARRGARTSRRRPIDARATSPSSPATRRSDAPFRAEVRIRHRARRSPVVRPRSTAAPASGRWIGRDRRAGLGRRARPGGRALRRRRRARWRADRAPARRSIRGARSPGGRPRRRRREHRPGARPRASSSASSTPRLFVLIRGNAGGRLPMHRSRRLSSARGPATRSADRLWLRRPDRSATSTWLGA